MRQTAQYKYCICKIFSIWTLVLKWIVYPQKKFVIIYSLSVCSKPVFSFFCGTPKKIFWRMCVTKQLTVAIDCRSSRSIKSGSFDWYATERDSSTKPVRPSFIFGTQIKIFWMKSRRFLIFHRQQHNNHVQGPERIRTSNEYFLCTKKKIHFG